MTCTTGVASRRPPHRTASALLVLVVALTCSAMSTSAPPTASPAAIVVAPDEAAATDPPGTGDAPGTRDTGSDPAAGYADNPFIPENQNFGDCASSLPPPDCGSPARGGPLQLLTLAALVLGMAFIGWRISVGVRKRDRSRDREAAPASGPGG